MTGKPLLCISSEYRKTKTKIIINNNQDKENIARNQWGPNNRLQPNISMCILLTILFTFLEALTRRVCQTTKSFFD